MNVRPFMQIHADYPKYLTEPATICYFVVSKYWNHER